jgi:8-oxo-dGTP pyrophosphatase MutT (NUDIX family)
LDVSLFYQKDGKSQAVHLKKGRIPMTERAKRLGRTVKCKGRWLALTELEYEGHDGRKRVWECVERVSCGGAVAILATLKPSGKLILVRQYRPPLDAFAIEFPAGLVDRGEEPAATALRELKEETGYVGRLVKMMPVGYNSPGLTQEGVHLAIVEVDEDAQGELKTKFDESESIETMLVERKELGAFLAKAVAAGDKLDAKVEAFAVALELA